MHELLFEKRAVTFVQRSHFLLLLNQFNTVNVKYFFANLKIKIKTNS